MRLLEAKHNFSTLSTELIPAVKKLKHSPLFPSDIRAIISGPSGSGKTLLMVSLLLHENGLRFANVFLFSNTAHQPLYQSASDIINSIDGMCFKIITPENFNEGMRLPCYSVLIFDDISPEYFTILKEMFCYGRHNKNDVFLLTQSYILSPKHFCRENSNIIILFRTDSVNLLHVFKEHVIGDTSFPQFLNMCNVAWGEKYGFLSIFKDMERENGRYRSGFDRFFHSINDDEDKRSQH